LGQKTHPIGFRLGTTVPWQARWFAASGKAYSALAIEDQKIRTMIATRYEDSGGISKTEIERGPQELVISIHTARPGIVIGRGGTRVDELRGDLEKLTGKRARLNIQEIRQPELDAFLVARNVAEQLERRVAFRRAMRQSVTRTMQAGAEGIKILCSGRLGGAEIARSEKAMDGRVPLHTLRANVDFAIAEAATTFGRIGVKAWVYTGDITTAAAIAGTAMRQTDAPADETRPRRRRSGGRPAAGGGGGSRSGGRGGSGGGDKATVDEAKKAEKAEAPVAEVEEANVVETPPETPKAKAAPKAAPKAKASEAAKTPEAPETEAAAEDSSDESKE
jgi:small subunit ribosomal protein S3